MVSLKPRGGLSDYSKLATALGRAPATAQRKVPPIPSASHCTNGHRSPLLLSGCAPRPHGQGVPNPRTASSELGVPRTWSRGAHPANESQTRDLFANRFNSAFILNDSHRCVDGVPVSSATIGGPARALLPFSRRHGSSDLGQILEAQAPPWQV